MPLTGTVDQAIHVAKVNEYPTQTGKLSPVDRLLLIRLVYAFGLVIGGFFCLPWDTAISGFVKNHGNFDWKPIQLAEAFAHGWGVALILMGVVWLTPRKLPNLPTLLCCAYGSGILANLGKVLLARVRPHSFDLTRPITESFVSWFPFFTGGYAIVPHGKLSAWQAFPSAHAATAVGLALGLTAIYPRGRVYFSILAVLACLQRVESMSHFASDVCWGAAVGMVVASITLSDRLWGSWFTAWNTHLQTRWQKFLD
ncbi:MAG: phosphatase PAP2 family protein [Pirellulales bacterium]|nr:phosphatase PAP2 family protein [Pirellulales bacterium]